MRKTIGSIFTLIGKGAMAAQSAVAAYFFIKEKVEPKKPKKRRPGRPRRSAAKPQKGHQALVGSSTQINPTPAKRGPGRPRKLNP